MYVFNTFRWLPFRRRERAVTGDCPSRKVGDIKAGVTGRRCSSESPHKRKGWLCAFHSEAEGLEVSLDLAWNA